MHHATWLWCRCLILLFTCRLCRPLCTPCRFTMQYNTGASRGDEGRLVQGVPAGALLVRHANETMLPLCGPQPWFTFLSCAARCAALCEQTVTLPTACGRTAMRSAVRGLDSACTVPFVACLLVAATRLCCWAVPCCAASALVLLS